MWNRLTVISSLMLWLMLPAFAQDAGELLRKGNGFYNTSSFDSALYYFEKALKLYNRENDERSVALVVSNIGNVYEDLSQYNKALDHYRTALDISRKINDSEGISSALNQIGNIYYRWSDYEVALKYYQDGLAIRKETGDEYGIPSSLNNIGNIYYSWGKHDKALENYLLALELKEKLPDKTELSSYLINVGSAYLSMQQYENAFSYYQRALNNAKEADNSHMMASCMINIGVLYFEQGNYGKAITYYNEAYELVRELGSKLEEAIILRNLGETWLAMDETTKAKNFFLESMNIARNENMNSLLAEVYRFMYECEKLNGNIEAALSYHELYSSLNDSIFNEESSRKLYEMQAKFENERKENELKAKDLELVKKQRQLQLQRMWFIIIAVVLILLTSMVYFYLRNREIKKRIALEQELNMQMQKALSAQMNPHFISNALNSIQKFFLSNDIETANEYLADFGALIRTILENSRHFRIPLQDELKSIELYLSLEALRLQNKFDYRVEVADNIDLQHTMIPSMIIQPYAENAIWHGIAPAERKCTISITMEKQGAFLECIIEDDGIGLKRSKEMKSRYNNIKRKSMGMNISMERIELLNKAEKGLFSVKIFDKSETSESLTGTKVILNIPT
ncbi:MAG: tetratricopeptide repeat protein [Bacteroidota bacterium]